jgi:hypothetical protein
MSEPSRHIGWIRDLPQFVAWASDKPRRESGLSFLRSGKGQNPFSVRAQEFGSETRRSSRPSIHCGRTPRGAASGRWVAVETVESFWTLCWSGENDLSFARLDSVGSWIGGAIARSSINREPAAGCVIRPKSSKSRTPRRKSITSAFASQAAKNRCRWWWQASG